jgi:hypothetical protein
VLRRALFVVLAAVAAVPAAADAKPKGQTLQAEAPFWMASVQVRQQIDAAGARGLSIEEIEALVRLGLAGEANKDEPVADPCPTLEPGTKPGTVHANACITYPGGCTANFLYHRGTEFDFVADGRRDFIGTAGHCVDHSGQPVYMDNGSGMVVRVGEVAKHVDGGIGNDMALIRIDEGLPLDPRMPSVGGPRGIYAGCVGGQALSWWGHGYGVAVGQGNVGTGVDARWWDKPFGWKGDSLPGDSGSGVVLTENLQAAGDLTHLVVHPDRYGTSFNAGTRMTHILQWAGGDMKLVGEDGELYTAPRNTGCGNPNSGNGS